ncbi:MAG: 16S rRNA (cytosine(1402)-N(4))-methyltransferase RsmH [Lentisphaeria bacterium]|nr:16S rRNA (cytosine(1402)-N(4))-methyltransferase RsmH [Lentisphaeria bacterium]
MNMEQNNQFHHLPVLYREVLEHLTFDPDRRMRQIDGTIGGGGHSSLLLSRYPKLELLGIDRDDLALAAAKQKLEFASNRVTLVRGNYAELAAIAVEHGWDDVDGILLDIGVSSPQLDCADRGFSWRQDGPLDMRMDRRSTVTAGRWLNKASEDELIYAFRNYGELNCARKLAQAVIARRESNPFARTSDLVAIADQVMGRSRPGKLPHPTLLFQAVRIAVNDELRQLETALESSVGMLNPGGRIAVISFHSLEDRIVKNFFREESTSCICPPKLPVCCCNHKATLSCVTRKAVCAAADELKENPRAACAKLRVAERV